MLNHVALLVASLDEAIARVAALGLAVQPPERFPGEGTREAYVGDPSWTARLLLVEPDGPGPYARALAKRGPGLHHIALDAADLARYVRGLEGSGWMLLPQSLHTVPSSRTAWLARAGFPTLLEVHERAPIAEDPTQIEALTLPLSAADATRLAALGCNALRAAPLEATLHARFAAAALGAAQAREVALATLF